GAAAAAVTAANLAGTSITSATRTWTDLNRDFVPDCDFTDPNPKLECGRLSNAAFGGNDPTVATIDPSVLHGFGVRPYQWETTAALQRQIVEGWSVTASYVRRSLGNFTVTKNTTVSPADYDTYCITAPVDPRLPGGGGNQI